MSTKLTPVARARLAACAGSRVSTRSRGAARVGEAAHPRLTYRPELDGLRGVAVLAVMAFHYGMPWMPGGFLGVDVFFVLSGFLITSILVATQRSLGDFYLRRAQRLLPAFALMLAAVAFTVPIAQVLISAAYVENLSMAFGWLPISSSLGHTWSLAAEWQFYLLWPAALLVARRRWSLPTIGRAVLVLALVSAAWRAIGWNGDWVRADAGPDMHADTILLGAALALGVRIPFPRWGIALLAVPLSLGAFAVGAILSVGMATAAVIERPPRLLGWRPLVWIGKISYGLYLWHVPVWIWLVEIGLQHPPLASLAAGQPLPALVLTFLAAGLSYRYVEQPILRWRPKPRPPARAVAAAVTP